jgi:hypothetical protein
MKLTDEQLRTINVALRTFERACEREEHVACIPRDSRGVWDRERDRARATREAIQAEIDRRQVALLKASEK